MRKPIVTFVFFRVTCRNITYTLGEATEVEICKSPTAKASSAARIYKCLALYMDEHIHLPVWIVYTSLDTLFGLTHPQYSSWPNSCAPAASIFGIRRRQHPAAGPIWFAVSTRQYPDDRRSGNADPLYRYMCPRWVCADHDDVSRRPVILSIN